jgi:hypothetical protein
MYNVKFRFYLFDAAHNTTVKSRAALIHADFRSFRDVLDQKLADNGAPADVKEATSLLTFEDVVPLTKKDIENGFAQAEVQIHKA